MPTAAPFISLDHIAIRRRDQVLFEGLCWDMLSDQHWAVIGPNGSGKSTLIKALCGSLPIVKGRIVYHFVQGHDQSSPPSDIAYVNFESPGQVSKGEAFYQERWNLGVADDSLSVSEFLSPASVYRVNAYHIGEMHADANFATRQRAAIEDLELGRLFRRKVAELSNGERHKLLIARALLRSPRLLILDHPFTGLDERFRNKLAEYLDKLMRGDTHAPVGSASVRVMFVGTNRDDLPRSVTHILLLKDHRVVAQGPRESVWSRAATPRIDSLGTVAQISTDRNSKCVPSRKTLVQMDKVNVSYNGTPILKQIRWTLHEGERWALIGPNGAGKTTLLSLILADNPQAYAKDITLFGKRRGSGESIWEIKQKIGWLAPELQLYYPRDATCLDAVCSGWFDSVGLYRDCSPDQRTIAREWLNQFGLATRADFRFSEISEGEQRLALLARALVKDPLLLVLDEPCQGLDAENRDRLLKVIDQTSRRPSASMIYVTHRADELPQGITHVLRMDKGHIIEQGAKRNHDEKLRSGI